MLLRNRFAAMIATHTVAAILFAAATVAVYSNTLDSPFYFDDLPNIIENAHIRLAELSFGGLIDLIKMSGNRPIPAISFALNYLLGGYDPFGYHLVNMIIHVLTGLLLFMFLHTTIVLSDRQSPGTQLAHRMPAVPLAFTAALLWIVHPVNTQSVTYIVQRMNSMSAMFCLLSLNLYIAGRSKACKRSIPYLVSAVISWLLAVASKENAVILPLLTLIYEWFFMQGLDRRWLKYSLKYMLFACVLIGGLAALGLGADPLHKLRSLRDFSEGHFTFFQRILTQPRVVVIYLSLFFYPHPSRLNLDYDLPVSLSLLNPPTTLLSALLLAAILALSLSAARKHRLVSFCMLWFFINLAIESSILPLALIFEHRTYMPFMGLSLLSVLIIDRLVNYRMAGFIILGLLVFTAALWTYQRNATWKDAVALWQDCVDKSPHKARPRFSLGAAFAERGAYDEALAQYRMALEIDPEYGEVYNNIGNIHARWGDYDEAEGYYRKAIQLQPAYVKAYHNLAAALMARERYDEAFSYLEKALGLDPGFAEVHARMGEIYLLLGKNDQALEAFREALDLSPEMTLAHNGIGKIYAANKNFDKSLLHFKKALEGDPINSELLVNIGKILQQKDQPRQALDYYRRAIASDPKNTAAHFNMANTYLALGDREDAEQHYREALRLDNGLVEAHTNLGLLLADRGGTAEALDHYREAIALAPMNAGAHNNFGNMLAKLGDFDSALIHYREAIRLDPDFDDARVNLGIALLRMGNTEDAGRQFERALQANPANARARQGLEALQTSSAGLSLGQLHRKALEHAGRGEYQAAVELFKKILAMMPSEPGTCYNIACMYAKMGDTAAALEWLERAIQNGYDNWDAVKNDPDLDGIRQSEAYKALVKGR